MDRVSVFRRFYLVEACFGFDGRSSFERNDLGSFDRNAQGKLGGCKKA